MLRLFGRVLHFSHLPVRNRDRLPIQIGPFSRKKLTSALRDRPGISIRTRTMDDPLDSFVHVSIRIGKIMHRERRGDFFDDLFIGQLGKVRMILRMPSEFRSQHLGQRDDLIPIAHRFNSRNRSRLNFFPVVRPDVVSLDEQIN